MLTTICLTPNNLIGLLVRTHILFPTCLMMTVILRMIVFRGHVHQREMNLAKVTKLQRDLHLQRLLFQVCNILGD